jgi:hypothetical protein
LRVVHGCEGYFDFDLVVEILEYVTVELLGVVNCYLSRHSEMTYYVLSKKTF